MTIKVNCWLVSPKKHALAVSVFRIKEESYPDFQRSKET